MTAMQRQRWRILEPTWSILWRSPNHRSGGKGARSILRVIQCSRWPRGQCETDLLLPAQRKREMAWTPPHWQSLLVRQMETPARHWVPAVGEVDARKSARLPVSRRLLLMGTSISCIKRGVPNSMVWIYHVCRSSCTSKNP